MLFVSIHQRLQQALRFTEDWIKLHFKIY